MRKRINPANINIKEWDKMDRQFDRAVKMLQESHSYLSKAGNVRKHITFTAGSKKIT